MKKHELNRVIISGNEYLFFYRRDKNDINGNARFRVFFLDLETATVYETILKCYESQIPARVAALIERQGE
jgi:hypothetical protein